MAAGRLPRVIFVPGFMQRGDAWQAVASRVAQRYPTTCLDHRAFDWERRVAEIEAAAPPGAVIAGYSLGGRLALRAALRAPGRYGGLLLVGASPGIEDEQERIARRTADTELADWIETHAIEQVVARWEALPVFAGQSPALVAAQRPGRLSHEPRRLAELLRSAGQGALEPLHDRLHELGDLPLLALAGERDRSYAAAARRVAELAPLGSCLTIRAAGHAPHLERPDAVASALLDFLDEHLR